jgi:hypothetical protein
MPYERAVDVARSAEQLDAADRGRLVSYVVAYSGMTDALLASLVATRPELVATAMLDKGLIVPPEGALVYDYSWAGEPAAVRKAS